MDILLQEIIDLQERTEEVYIYGYGSYGRNLLKILTRKGISVDGIVVSGGAQQQTGNMGIPILKASCLFGKKVGYILALNEKNRKEVEQYLSEHNVPKERIINAGKYLEKFGTKRGINVGSIEVTPVIGCKVNCQHCPQDLLISQYFRNDRNRVAKMDIKTFKKCLDFFPKEYDISFGGMAEPFLNERFVEMLKIACEEGRHVSLYTTLVGATTADIEEILKLPLQFVVLHVADQKGYAHIPLTEDYYKNLDKLINAKKANGEPFVNMCNAQAEADIRVAKICGDYEIFTEMTDRAGNLKNEELIHNEIAKGKLSCGNLGQEMNNNILLPDGTVVLCCMDYGLKHILGNIFTNTFEEIMNGEEMRKVKEGMDGNEALDILCRNCSYAHAVMEQEA